MRPAPKRGRKFSQLSPRQFAAKPEELELNNSRVVHRESKRKMSFAEVVKAKGSPIKVQGYYKSAEKAHDASISAQIAEVHGSRDRPGYLATDDVGPHDGKVINPLMHQGQIEGGVVFGLGYALTEEVMFDGGRVTTTNFGEFKIPQHSGYPTASKPRSWRRCRMVPALTIVSAMWGGGFAPPGPRRWPMR